jgi:hypothetical protein
VRLACSAQSVGNATPDGRRFQLIRRKAGGLTHRKSWTLISQSSQGTALPAEEWDVAQSSTEAKPLEAPEVELEIDRLLAAFCENPDDEQTFGKLDALLRGGGRWELAGDDEHSNPTPSRGG